MIAAFGTNSPDPAQDSQASIKKAAPVPSGLFHSPEREAVLLPCRDCKPALRPAKPRVFVKPREISVSVGLRGGAGRTQTSNQPVMDSVSRSLASIFTFDTRKPSKKMIAERTGILPRTER